MMMISHHLLIVDGSGILAVAWALLDTVAGFCQCGCFVMRCVSARLSGLSRGCFVMAKGRAYLEGPAVQRSPVVRLALHVSLVEALRSSAAPALCEQAVLIF